MGRRGGFPGGFGGGNMNQLLKQAKKMQEKMEQMQKELEEEVVEGSAGGGMVKCKVNGRLEILSIEISPEVVDPDDIETLQDLILAAVRNGIEKANKMMSDQMSQITGGLNIPGLF